MVLTATRSNEVRGAACDEVEHDVWTIPADRMKAKREHRVPLVGAGLGDPRGSPEAPRRWRDRVPGREGRKDPRLDVQQVAPASRHRRNVPRDEVLVPRLVLGDGRGARGGGGRRSHTRSAVRPRPPTPARTCWTGGARSCRLGPCISLASVETRRPNRSAEALARDSAPSIPPGRPALRRSSRAGGRLLPSRCWDRSRGGRVGSRASRGDESPPKPDSLRFRL